MNSADWVTFDAQARDDLNEWGMLVTPALPPKFDAVVHSYAKRFDAYKLVNSNRIPERRTRFGYASKEPSGFFSGALMLYPDSWGAEHFFPTDFEWTEIEPELHGGRLKVGTLERLKPELEKAERRGKETAAEFAKDHDATLTSVQEKWLTDYAGAEKLYRLFIAEMMGVKNPEKLSELCLENMERMTGLAVKSKDEFIFEMIGECPPEPEKSVLVPIAKEFENDFWAYIKNMKTEGFSIKKGAA